MITNIGTKKRKTLYNEVLTKERNRTDRSDESDSITTILVTKEPRGQRHSKMAASASRKSNHGFGQPYLFGLPFFSQVLTKERNRTDRSDESDSITTILVTKEPRGQRHSKMAASASRKSNHGFGQPYLFGLPFFSQVGVTKNNSRRHCSINFALVIFKKYR